MQIRNAFNSSHSSLKDSLLNTKKAQNSARSINSYSNTPNANSYSSAHSKSNSKPKQITNNTDSKFYGSKRGNSNEPSSNSRYGGNTNYAELNFNSNAPKESITASNLIYQQVERGQSNANTNNGSMFRPVTSSPNNVYLNLQRELVNSPRQDAFRSSSSVAPSNKISSYSNLGIKNPNRFLPEKPYNKSGKKTLILDLDETLVHSAFKPLFVKSDIILNVELERKLHIIHVLKRPGVEEFLERMARHYEVVIFTASLSPYANPLIDQLDVKRHVNFRLFREHCTPVNGMFIKDMKKLGRDLKDVIIVDNNPVSFAFNPDNGIPCKTWYNDKSDKELSSLAPILEFLAYTNDVRDYIKKFINNNEINFKLAYSIISNNNLNNTTPLNTIGKFNNTSGTGFNNISGTGIHLETPSYRTPTENLVTSKSALGNRTAITPPVQSININIISHSHSHIYLNEFEQNQKIEDNNNKLNSSTSNKYSENKVNLFNKSSTNKEARDSTSVNNFIKLTPATASNSNSNSTTNKYSSLMNSNNNKYNSYIDRPSTAVIPMNNGGYSSHVNNHLKNTVGYNNKYDSASSNYYSTQANKIKANNPTKTSSSSFNHLEIDLTKDDRKSPHNNNVRPLTSDKNIKNNINNLINSMNTPKRSNLTPISTSKNGVNPKNSFEEINQKNKPYTFTSRSVDRTKSKLPMSNYYKNDSSFNDRNIYETNTTINLKSNNSYASNSNKNSSSIKNLNPYNYSYQYTPLRDDYYVSSYKSNVVDNDHLNNLGSNSNTNGIYSQSMRERFYQSGNSKALYD